MPFEKYQYWFDKVNALIGSQLRASVPYVQQLADYQRLSSGKMLRPLLVLLSAKMCGEPTDNTLRTAAAMEILHNATLLHDDVLDDAAVRHAQATVNSLWDSKSAVLLGDYYLTRALTLLADTGSLGYIAVVLDCATDLAQGELLQQASMSNSDVENYFRVVELKTSSLFVACARAGAMSAGASEEQIAAMSKFAKNLGIAFQIKDDILDYSPAYAQKIGKPVLHDIYEGKITLPLIRALEAATPQERQQVMQQIRLKNFNDSDILNFVVNYHGIDLAHQTMLMRLDDARGSLFAQNSEAYHQLCDMLDFVAQRNY